MKKKKKKSMDVMVVTMGELTPERKKELEEEVKSHIKSQMEEFDKFDDDE